MRSWLLVLMLTFSILPSMEVVETVMHLVEHGDLAHDDHDRRGDALGTGEHGCSGSFHLCGHAANMIPPSGQPMVQPLEFPPTVTQFSLASSHGRGAMAPPIRPPIA